MVNKKRRKPTTVDGASQIEVLGEIAMNPNLSVREAASAIKFNAIRSSLMTIQIEKHNFA